MAETPEQQRQRLEQKRIQESDEDLIKCLECPLRFRRIGSHVVQVHGYESVAEYRKEHGLMARETRVESHARQMRREASTIDNLEKGAHRRFKKGDSHGEQVKEFWKNRKEKLSNS